jgi:hypothetical protein
MLLCSLEDYNIKCFVLEGKSIDKVTDIHGTLQAVTKYFKLLIAEGNC